MKIIKDENIFIKLLILLVICILLISFWNYFSKIIMLVIFALLLSPVAFLISFIVIYILSTPYYFLGKYFKKNKFSKSKSIEYFLLSNIPQVIIVCFFIYSIFYETDGTNIKGNGLANGVCFAWLIVIIIGVFSMNIYSCLKGFRKEADNPIYKIIENIND